MAIEVWGVVVRREWDVLNWVDANHDYSHTSYVSNEAVFCRLKLIEKGKVLKWDILRRIVRLPTEENIRLYHYRDFPQLNLWMFNNPDSLEEVWIPIDDAIPVHTMNVTMKHIRYLYPECAKMPRAYAHDYIRDRL